MAKEAGKAKKLKRLVIGLRSFKSVKPPWPETPFSLSDIRHNVYFTTSIFVTRASGLLYPSLPAVEKTR